MIETEGVHVSMLEPTPSAGSPDQRLLQVTISALLLVQGSPSLAGQRLLGSHTPLKTYPSALQQEPRCRKQKSSPDVGELSHCQWEQHSVSIQQECISTPSLPPTPFILCLRPQAVIVRMENKQSTWNNSRAEVFLICFMF